MQSENKMFDDLVKMVNGVAGTFAGPPRAEGAMPRGERVGGGTISSTHEFEAVKAMAAAARDENDLLKARIAVLEAKTAGPPAGSASARRAPGSGPAAGKKPKPEVRP